MKAEDIKRAAGCAGLNITELANKAGQGKHNLYNKLARGGIGIITDKELENLAQAMGAKYYCFIEFPNGAKFGDYPGANKEEKLEEK